LCVLHHAGFIAEPQPQPQLTQPAFFFFVSLKYSTKSDYLSQNLRYDPTTGDLHDGDNDAVMMEWERPLMNLHASVICKEGQKNLNVLNVGFGMGIIDGYLQSYEPSKHYIMEAHPDVLKKMDADGWDTKENVTIMRGRWQDTFQTVIDSGVRFDGIFFDTYGEHFSDMDEFHTKVVTKLLKADGIYSFFNGLAPDNVFFHGVSCNCLKIQLGALGFDVDFLTCEIQVKDDEWKNTRRKYWHFDHYFLPVCTFKDEQIEKSKSDDDGQNINNGNAKCDKENGDKDNDNDNDNDNDIGGARKRQKI